MDTEVQELFAQHGLDIVMTCGACPEQYEVFKDGIQVGYLRLRHGAFRVDYPHCMGEVILEEDPDGDGCFEHYERLPYMRKAMKAILDRIELEIA